RRTDRARVMSEVVDLRRRRGDRRRRIPALGPDRRAGVEAETGELMRDVGMSREIVRVVRKGDERQALWIDRDLEKVRQVSVGARAGREAGKADVRAVDEMIARD